MRALIGGALASTIVFVSAAPAAAINDTIAYYFEEPKAVTVEYGEYWSFALAGDYDLSDLWASDPELYSTPGLPGDYKPGMTFYRVSQPNTYAASGAGLITASPVSSLPAGSYSFNLKIFGTSDLGYTYYDSSREPAALTIEPARLGIETRIVDDPSNPALAIVTARFTGRFVDEYVSSYYPSSGLSPSGSWTIQIFAPDGELVEEKTVDRVEGADVLSTSFIWSPAQPGDQYTATASFTPSGASAANFTIGESAEFDYTASTEKRPVPNSTATSGPAPTAPESPDFSVPLWWVIVIGLVFTALIVFAVILGVRVGRTRVDAAPTDSSDERAAADDER